MDQRGIACTALDNGLLECAEPERLPGRPRPGPGGGAERDPLGTVYFGVADSAGVRVTRRQFGGVRQWVRALAAQTALELLRRRVLGLGEA